MVDLSQQPEQLRVLYQKRFEAQRDYRYQVWKVLCSGFFQKFIPPSSRLLELGVGWGEFINNISAQTKYGIDLNPDSKLKLDSATQFFQQQVTDPWPVEDESLDVVFTSNLLEHLNSKKDVEQAISHAYQALKPGGRIICLGPNIAYLPGHYWDFWDHKIPISDASLCELLALKNFTVEHRFPRFLPYSMSDSKQSPIFLVHLYLKLPFVWRFFGKQFLIVATKNGPE
jgi:SAM-dependent methyltransferase